MKAYIKDLDDKYVVNHGHQLYLLLDKFSKYSVLYPGYLARFYKDEVADAIIGDEIPGETHDQGEFPKDEMDEIVAEAEKNRAS